MNKLKLDPFEERMAREIEVCKKLRKMSPGEFCDWLRKGEEKNEFLRWSYVYDYLLWKEIHSD